MIRAAAGCALAALAIWAAAFEVGFLHDADGALLVEAKEYGETVFEPVVEGALNLIHPYIYGPLCALLVLAARGRDRVAVIVLLGGANVTTQLLKPALAEQRIEPGLLEQVDAASWPSGHATAAVAAALALHYVTRDRRARLAALALAAFISAGVVVDGWHYPSDALGGWAVAGFWFFAVQALRPLPGSHSGSSPPLAPRARMNSRSESRFR